MGDAALMYGVIVGLGGLLINLAIFFGLVMLLRVLKAWTRTEEKILVFQEMILDKKAKKKGYDLEKEIIRRELAKTRSFRDKVRDEIYKEEFKEQGGK